MTKFAKRMQIALRVCTEEEELLELMFNPIGTITSELPPDRLRIRQSIGCKIQAALELKLTSVHPYALEILHQYPLWKFYGSAKGCIYRVYGIAGHSKEHGWLLNSYNLRMFVNRDGYAMPGAVIPLDDWTEEQKKAMKMGVDGFLYMGLDAFWDPLGFLCLIS